MKNSKYKEIESHYLNILNIINSSSEQLSLLLEKEKKEINKELNSLKKLKDNNKIQFNKLEENLIEHWNNFLLVKLKYIKDKSFLFKFLNIFSDELNEINDIETELKFINLNLEDFPDYEIKLENILNSIITKNRTMLFNLFISISLFFLGLYFGCNK